MFRRDDPIGFRPGNEAGLGQNRAPHPKIATSQATAHLASVMFASEYLVLAFTAFLVALIWSAIGYQIDHDRAAVLDTAQVNTRNLARAYAEHVQGTLQLLDQALLRVKNEYESKSHDPDFLRRVMADEQIEAQVVPMGVTDRDGYVIASNLRRGVGCEIAADGVARRHLWRRPRLLPRPGKRPDPLASMSARRLSAASTARPRSR